MRPSAPRLVRVLRRTQLQGTPAIRRLVPEPVHQNARPPVLIEVLRQRQVQAGANYPSNIRIEPIITKRTFRNVPAEARDQLRRLIKER
ncbi:unnamed protein product [Somion occarium]|uniref:Uncharacterized protein n=1 Tax=Somion occarium TaxID=3059160 RepID=A0ABP1DB30_9APHY